MTAVVLAGHGSLVSPETGGLVRRAADQLRKWGVADEVTAAFWKEPPGFASVADSLASNKLIVVPVFAARGFFVDAVLRSEFDAGRKFDGWYTAPVGEHRIVNRLIEEAARRGLASTDGDAEVIVVGHGTPQHPNSRETTVLAAFRLGRLGLANSVIPAFLSDLPSILDALRLCKARTLVAVPNFIALGSHAGGDVPAAFGLPPGEFDAVVSGRRIIYSPPTLTPEAVAEIAWRHVRLISRIHGLGARRHSTTPWSGFPRAGREWLAERLHANSAGFAFAELLVTPRHVQRLGGSGPQETLRTPTELREWLMEQPFRAMPYLKGLRGGWRISLPTPKDAIAVVETVYPGMLGDHMRIIENRRPATPLPQLLERQQGGFKKLLSVPQARLDEAIPPLCGQCARAPAWFGAKPSDAVPACPEACNWLLTQLNLQFGRSSAAPS